MNYARLKDNRTDNLCPHHTYNVSALVREEDKLCANFLQQFKTATD